MPTPKKKPKPKKGNWFTDRASKNQQAKYLKSHPNSRYKKSGVNLDGAVTTKAPPSKLQHAQNRAQVKNSTTIKTAQDAKLRKGQAMAKLRTQLATFPPRPSDAKKAAAWTQRKQALLNRIKSVRDSMRATDQRVMSLRARR